MEGVKLTDVKNLDQDIEAVETGYEFLLAYAAQGRPPHIESESPTPHVSPSLQSMLQAMANVVAALKDSQDE